MTQSLLSRQLLDQADLQLTREVTRARQLAYTALEQARQEQDWYSVIRAFLLLGMTHIHSGAGAQALEHLDEAAQLLTSHAFPDLEARLLNSRGLALQQSDEFGKALEAYREALRLSEQLELPPYRIISNIALLYIGVEEYDRAAEYLEQAIEGVTGRDLSLELTFRLNLLYCDLQRGHLEAVCEEGYRLLSRADLGEFQRLLALVRGNLAPALMKLGRLEEALAEAWKAYDEAMRQNLLHTQSDLLKTIGEIELGLGRLPDAEAHLLRALAEARGIKEVQVQLEAHQVLQQLYRQQGNFEAALNHAEAQQSHMQKRYRELALRRTQVASAEFELQRLRMLAQDHQERNVELLRLSRHDSLTGLLNRLGLVAFAESWLSSPPDSLSALLVLDLNGFKQINDLWGHDTGDALLIEVARRIESALPEAVSARQGGDEFVSCLSNLDSEAQAAALAQELSERIADPVVLSQTPGVTHQVTAAIGVAFYPRDGRTLRDLQHSADMAMYQAKRQGYAVAVAPV